MIKRIIPLLVFLSMFLFVPAWCLADDSIEMADALRANGKFYVVVAVLAVIFVGLVVYLIRLDRRISRLERQHSSVPRN